MTVEDSVIITIKITPEGRWSDKAVKAVTETLAEEVREYCLVNNRPADVTATWAIYEGAEE